MACAGPDANVSEFVDGAGAMHKIVVFKPQPGLTPEMALFYQSGAFPLNVTVNGKARKMRAPRAAPRAAGARGDLAGHCARMPGVAHGFWAWCMPSSPLTAPTPTTRVPRRQSFFWYHLWHPIDHIFSENRWAERRCARGRGPCHLQGRPLTLNPL